MEFVTDWRVPTWSGQEALNGRDADRRVAELVDSLEALDRKYPGHVRGFLGAERCDRLLRALSDQSTDDIGPARHTSAGDLGLCHGVDSCVHGRSVWDCPECEAGRLSELVSLWGRDTAAAASCRRSVRMVWPELGERLDDLLDQQDGGDTDA